MSDPGVSGNATSCLVAGIIYNNEGDHVAALKACHTGLSLEMCVPYIWEVVQPSLKMHC